MTLHLVLPVILPLGGAALSLLCRRSTRVQRLIGLACCGGLLVYLAAALWPLLGRLGHVTLRIGNWPAPYGIVLAADLLAGIMLSLTAVVGLVVLAYAAAWLRDQPEESLFYPLYLVLLMGVNGAFLTGDIFNLY
ncbi:MAG: Na+/H+ antiporter subunit D, partial [Anaerolineae bacterium]|nr:Na+/H+ antiporter subunit D [Anaerolineae bacterium]